MVSVSQTSTCCAAESKKRTLVIEMSDHLSGTDIAYVSFHSQTDSPGNWFHQPELQDYRSTISQSAFVSPFTWWTWTNLGNSDNSQPSPVTPRSDPAARPGKLLCHVSQPTCLWTAQSTNKMPWSSCKHDLNRWTCWAIMQIRTYNFLKTMPSFSQCHF